MTARKPNKGFRNRLKQAGDIFLDNFKNTRLSGKGRTKDWEKSIADKIEQEGGWTAAEKRALDRWLSLPESERKAMEEWLKKHGKRK